MLSLTHQYKSSSTLIKLANHANPRDFQQGAYTKTPNKSANPETACQLGLYSLAQTHPVRAWNLSQNMQTIISSILIMSAMYV